MERILVPTDGSQLSECAVPLAETLCRAQEAEALFAQIVEIPRWANFEAEGYTSAQVYDDLLAALEEEARGNLDGLVGRFHQQGLKATSILRNGSPSMELLQIEEEQRPDLVVMGSHGRTGLARFALGSVADRLLREGSSPVLVVRSFGASTTSLERALVPLDGSPVAEQALTVVEALAGKPLRSVRLLRAIAAATERAEVEAYLGQMAQQLGRAGLQTDTDVRAEEPASAIEGAAKSVDVVIMATHGRGGMDRLRHGSVAEQVARQVSLPVLLVRAGGAS